MGDSCRRMMPRLTFLWPWEKLKPIHFFSFFLGYREEKLGSVEGGGTGMAYGGHLEDEWVFWAEWRKSFFLGDEDISGLMEPLRKGQWANTAHKAAFTAIAIPPSVRCVIFLTLCSLQQPSTDFYMRILEYRAVLHPKGHRLNHRFFTGCRDFAGGREFHRLPPQADAHSAHIAAADRMRPV